MIFESDYFKQELIKSTNTDIEVRPFALSRNCREH